MKKLNRFAALAAIILLLVMGCKVEPDAIAVESVLLSETTLTIEPGKTGRLTATITPDNADDKTVKWSSSNEKVALVDSNGTFVTIKEGMAIITAQAGDKTAMCIVTVKSEVAVKSITLSETTLTLTPYTTMKLTATILPYNADATVTWSSSDNAIATVYNDGTVRAYAEGEAIITAQAGNKTATCTVTVHFHSYSGGKCTVCGAVQDFNGTIDENGVLTYYRGNESSVTIPDSVTSIGEKAFEWCTSLASVTIPTSVTSIGGWAFEYCTSLAEIQFEGTKERWNQIVGNSEMSDCDIVQCTDGYWLNPNCWIIEDGVLTHYYGNKATVEIPDSVTRIGTSAFYNCKSLASVTIPTSVTSIDDYAFQYCMSLTSVTIPDSVTSIGENAFGWCTNLAEIQFEGTKAQWKAIEGSDNVAVACVHCSDGYIGNPEHLVTSVTLDKNTLTLTCKETAKLTATVTPSNADDTTVTWTSSNTSIATVDNDGTITAVKAGTATITAQAGGRTATCAVTVKPSFIAVESVTLNQTTLTLIRNKTATLMATVTPSNADNKTVTWSSSDTSIATVSNTGTVTAVKAGTATITAKAGDKTATCELTVCIHSYSGGKCTKCGAKPYLEGGTIDNNGVLTKYTRNKATVVIPDGVTGIGDRAFFGCTSLTNVTIPDSVTDMTANAFSGCKNLKQVTYQGTIAQWCAIRKARDLMQYATAVFVNNLDLKNITKLDIPNDVTVIMPATFYNCTKLTNVTIPESVTSIEDYAFYNCTSLTSVTIPNSVTSIGMGAFEYCMSLESVTIPISVKSIGDWAFSVCTNLESVIYTGTLADWCAIDFSNGSANPLNEHDILYIKDSPVTDVQIPNNVTEIKDYAFAEYTSLTSVTIPNSVTSIGMDAFEYCMSLESVTIPISVKSIGDRAFSVCTNLKSVTIPGSVTSIGMDAFNHCTSLSSVTIGNGVVSIGGGAFSDCTSLTRVTIPNSVTSIGHKAFSCVKYVTYNGTKEEWGKIDKGNSIFSSVMTTISCTDGETYTY